MSVLADQDSFNRDPDPDFFLWYLIPDHPNPGFADKIFIENYKWK
jgi:hypothetical protein